jgi:hypothetical protein
VIQDQLVGYETRNPGSDQIVRQAAHSPAIQPGNLPGDLFSFRAQGASAHGDGTEAPE